MNQTEVQVISIDPTLILADDNARYGLKQTRIETLADSILEFGGVQVPVRVEALPEPVDGCLYRMLAGHYRQAAVLKLNKEQNAGLTLPVIIEESIDPTLRLKLQLSENVERENLSPMDQAIAIQKLKAAGVSVMEIRKIFSRPGGRKGLKVQIASNSFINMTLGFLQLSKAIQEKIHDGRIGVAAAYELTKVPAEKRAAVLQRAEEDRIAQIDREESDEEKFLKAEAKSNEALEKRNKQEEDLKIAQETAKVKADEVKAKAKAAADAYVLAKTGDVDDAAKAAAKANLKAAEEAASKAEKEHRAAVKAAEKLQEKVKTATELAADRAKKLKDARAKTAKGNAKAPAAVGAGNVKKAAAQEGVEGASAVPLKATEMRQAVADWCLPGSGPKVRAIAECIAECFAGITTTSQAYTKMCLIVGESSTPKKPKVTDQ